MSERPTSVQRLRDGTSVVIRGVVPSDRSTIESAFRRLSPRSRYDRFLIRVKELTDERLAFLDRLDGSKQAAVGAVTLDGTGVG